MTIPALGGLFSNSVTKRMVQGAAAAIAVTRASAEAMLSSSTAEGPADSSGYSKGGLAVLVALFASALAVGGVTYCYRNRRRAAYDRMSDVGEGLPPVGLDSTLDRGP